MDRYVLIGKVPVLEPDLDAWVRWFEEFENRIVQQDETDDPRTARHGAIHRGRALRIDGIDRVLVSTVFLGLDHNWSRHGPPLLFETMIFGGEHDGYQVRTSTWELALEEHEKALKLVR